MIAKPARDHNGYRRYDDSDVVRLRFVANAKNLGIPLEDVKQLVAAFDAEDCSTVAYQVVATVAARAAQTRAQIHQLTTLGTQLQAVAARLVEAPSAQLCDDGCPCTTVTLDKLAQSRTTLPVVGSMPAVEAPIACTLDAGAVGDAGVQSRPRPSEARTSCRRPPGGHGCPLVETLWRARGGRERGGPRPAWCLIDVKLPLDRVTNETVERDGAQSPRRSSRQG